MLKHVRLLLICILAVSVCGCAYKIIPLHTVETIQTSEGGAKVLYSATDQNTGNLKIWVMAVDGTNQSQLTLSEKSVEKHASWSPDGNRILYTSNIGKDSNGKRNYDVWMMDVNGSNFTQLTTNGSADIMPVSSPDGKHIYFLSNRGWVWNLWRMEVAL